MIIKSDYKNKFELLAPFMEELCRGIKKEIKQELIKKKTLQMSVNALDWSVISQNFFKKIVEDGDEETGEWLASTWIYKNGEIFQCFHEELSLVDEQYDRLESLSSEVEEKIKNLSASKFGALPVYLFCVLNSVVFSHKIFEDLRKRSLEEISMDRNDLKESSNNLSLEELKKSFEVERLKMEEKYEKRLQGVIKKTQMEVEGYRKQIGQLQKKLEKEQPTRG